MGNFYYPQTFRKNGDTLFINNLICTYLLDEIFSLRNEKYKIMFLRSRSFDIFMFVAKTLKEIDIVYKHLFDGLSSNATVNGNFLVYLNAVIVQM